MTTKDILCDSEVAKEFCGYIFDKFYKDVSWETVLVLFEIFGWIVK